MLPGAKTDSSYTVPYGVEDVFGAFDENQNLHSVYLPPTVDLGNSVNPFEYLPKDFTVYYYPDGNTKRTNYSAPYGHSHTSYYSYQTRQITYKSIGTKAQIGDTAYVYSSGSGWNKWNDYVPYGTSRIVGTGAVTIYNDSIYNSTVLVEDGITELQTIPGYSSVQKITIGSGVKEIKAEALSGSGLKTIIVSDSNPYFKVSDGDLYTIDGSTLVRCVVGKTGSVSLPSVKDISSYAFYHCRSITSVEIPSTVESITQYSFNDCTSLTSVNVSSDNAYYFSDNGVLYEKSDSKLFYYPDGKEDEEYDIVDGTKELVSFYSKKVQKLKVPDSVETISYIPQSVTMICSGESAAAVYARKNGNTVTYTDAPSITVQPASIEGTTEVFELSIETEGNVSGYQWQNSEDGENWTDVEGATGKTFDLMPYLTEDAYYRCVVSAPWGDKLTSDTAHVAITKKNLQLDQDLEDQDVMFGDETVLAVVASGDMLSYQWQYSEDGIDWQNVSWTDANKSELKFTADSDGYIGLYRCTIRDIWENSLTSYEAYLDIKKEPLVIKEQPDAGDGFSYGKSATLSVKATGKDLTYAWESSMDQQNWNPVTWSDNTASDLTWTVDDSCDKSYVRCRIQDSQGQSVTTKAVRINVIKTPIVISSITGDVTAYYNEFALFSVTATGEELQFVWQKSEDGTNWITLTPDDDTVISENELQVLAKSYQGYAFRCHIADSQNQESVTDAMKLTVEKRPLCFTKDLSDIEADYGTDAVFTVILNEDHSSTVFYWQTSSDQGETWSDIANATAETLTISNVDSSMNGHEYRCIVRDDQDQEITSCTAALIVTLPEFKITQQPQSVYAQIKDTVVFTVTVSGKNLTYQWQYSRDKGNTFTDFSGKTASSLSYRIPSDNGYLFRCVIKDVTGRELVSDAAGFTIGIRPSLADYELLRTAYFDGKVVTVDQLNNKDLPSMEIDTSEYPNAAVTLAGSLPNGLIFQGINLVLNDDDTITPQAVFLCTKEAEDYSFTVNGEEVTSVMSSETNPGYLVIVPNGDISAKDLMTEFTITISSASDTENTATLIFTPMAYVKMVLEDASDVDTAAPVSLSYLMKALVVYYQSIA